VFFFFFGCEVTINSFFFNKKIKSKNDSGIIVGTLGVY